MDFHSLSRRELQSLCKLNKIPANITNVAMADALQSLDIVEGIEEFLNVSQSETADLAESTKTVEALSPKAPQTRCRTTIRQKVKSTETENLPPTATRTTRRGTKQVGKGVEETKTDMLKTPAISSSRRKAPANSSCRNVSSQLNECANESTASKTTLRKDSTLLKTYSTRRSTRLTEKKSVEPREKKDSEEAVKIDSFLDESVEEEVQENTVESGNPNAEVEDICNAFEKLDVLVVEEGEGTLVREETVNVESTHVSEEEEKDYVEIDQELDGDFEEQLKNEEKFDVEEKDSPCEDKNLVQKLDLGEEKCDASEVSFMAITDSNLSAIKEHNVVMVQEEQSDSLIHNDTILDSGVAGADDIDVGAIPFNTENNFSAADETTTTDLEVTEITVDETFDVNDNLPIMTEEVPDFKPELYPEIDVNEKVDAESGVTTQGFEDSSIEEKNHFCAFSAPPCLPTRNPLILSDIVGHPTRVTPIKKATPFKSISIVSDDKENIDSGRKLQMVFVDEGMKSKKEKDEKEKKQMSLHEISMRQLRKQIKELTLKNISSKEDASKNAATTRPALQALCENQLMAGETKN